MLIPKISAASLRVYNFSIFNHAPLIVLFAWKTIVDQNEISKSHEYAGSRNCQRMVSDFEERPRRRCGAIYIGEYRRGLWSNIVWISVTFATHP